MRTPIGAPCVGLEHTLNLVVSKAPAVRAAVQSRTSLEASREAIPFLCEMLAETLPVAGSVDPDLIE